MSERRIRRQHASQRDDIGELVTRRPLPGPSIDQIDPFLFLNHHGPQTYAPGNRGLPFGPHPHRGFETVTFIVEGELAHTDSSRHESVIGAGGVQWMTAGSGIVHAELSPQEFKDRGGPLEILQLWVNLPARLKMTRPGYIGLQRDQIPVLQTPDGKGVVNLISGLLGGETGPVPSLTGTFMSTVFLAGGGEARFHELRGRSIFLYVVRGRVRIGHEVAPAHVLVELSAEGDRLTIDAMADSLLVFGHADPIMEPVVHYGPFVMNSRGEIQQAIADYQAGRFGGIA